MHTYNVSMSAIYIHTMNISCFVSVTLNGKLLQSAKLN